MSCENLHPAPRWHFPFVKSKHTPSLFLSCFLSLLAELVGPLCPPISERSVTSRSDAVHLRVRSLLRSAPTSTTRFNPLSFRTVSTGTHACRACSFWTVLVGVFFPPVSNVRSLFGARGRSNAPQETELGVPGCAFQRSAASGDVRSCPCFASPSSFAVRPRSYPASSCTHLVRASTSCFCPSPSARRARSCTSSFAPRALFRASSTAVRATCFRTGGIAVHGAAGTRQGTSPASKGRLVRRGASRGRLRGASMRRETRDVGWNGAHSHVWDTRRKPTPLPRTIPFSRRETAG